MSRAVPALTLRAALRDACCGLRYAAPWAIDALLEEGCIRRGWGKRWEWTPLGRSLGGGQ